MRSILAISSTRALDLGLGHAARRRAQREGEIVVDGKVRIERVLLEDEGDVARRRIERA